MSSPSSSTRPPVGDNTPVRRLTTVVLPAPFGPISAWRAPRAIDSDKSRVAASAPKFLLRPTVCKAAVIECLRRSWLAPTGRRLLRLVDLRLGEAEQRAEVTGRQTSPAPHPLAADQHDDDEHEADPELPVL